MARNLGPDIIGVLKGIQMVASESLKMQGNYSKHVWENSSVRALISETNGVLKERIQDNLGQKNISIDKFLSETISRTAMIPEGVRAFTKQIKEPKKEYVLADGELLEFNEDTMFEDIDHLLQGATKQSVLGVKDTPSTETKIGGDIRVLPIVISDSKTIESTSPKNIGIEKVPLIKPTEVKTVKSMEAATESIKVISTQKLVSDDVGSKDTGEKSKPEKEKGSVQTQKSEQKIPKYEVSPETKPKPTQKKKQTLSESAKQRKVPASRLSRLISFGTLAAGLGIGTVAEVTRRSLGMKEAPVEGQTLDSAFLTPANAERIVNTLCKVRGAALKIGQLLSIQDNNIISPVLQQAFERVRQAADFMPESQVKQVLNSEFGGNWPEKFSDFSMVPFAAASIGQVHYGKIHDGTEVAVKIQYPGVAKGIDSDIDNLMSVLKIWDVFPEGMYIDKVIEVAKKELAWEVDYEREAECTRKFKKLLEPYPEYYVPTVVGDLCTKQIFTSELIEGIPVDKCSELDMDTKKHICGLIMQLCLRELFQFRYMQTDPNWSNFFYNQDTKQLILLDFGATRHYSKEFMDKYIRVIKAASDGDREGVLTISREMGFLTGFESKAMEQAHVETVMILGEVFSETAGEFDFGKQDTTLRVTKLVPTILTHRLCAPPEEIYSLHRKLSGVFLLCSKLKIKMDCRQMFMNVYDKYVFGSESTLL